MCANARVHGHFDEAVGHGEASVRLFRELGAEISEGTALGELAFNYARQGRLSEARAAAERGAELVGGRESVSKAIGLYYLARVLRLCGDGKAALSRARDALALFRALGVTAFEAATGTLMAEVHAEAGHYTLAVGTAEEFMPLARRTSGMLEGALLRALGRSLCHLEQGGRGRGPAWRPPSTSSTGAGPWPMPNRPGRCWRASREGQFLYSPHKTRALSPPPPWMTLRKAPSVPFVS
ncbi:hypothetical protein GCM10020000_10710 [Streptomyces olivoverticillatus]